MGFVNMTGEKSNQSIIEGIREQDDTEILDLKGEIDMQSSRELRERFFEVTERAPRSVIVNMDHVSFMDSSGLATLVEALHRCRQSHSKLILVGLCQRVKSIFEISRLTQVFDIYETEQEALS